MSSCFPNFDERNEEITHQFYKPGPGLGKDLTGTRPGLDLDLTWTWTWTWTWSLTISVLNLNQIEHLVRVLAS